MKTYDTKLETSIAKVLYHHPELFEQEMINPNDFQSNIRDAIENMVAIAKRSSTPMFDSTTIGRDFPEQTMDLENTKKFKEAKSKLGLTILK